MMKRRSSLLLLLCLVGVVSWLVCTVPCEASRQSHGRKTSGRKDEGSKVTMVSFGDSYECNERCGQKVWCYETKRRPYLSFREVWSDIRFELVRGSACLIGDSSDTSARIENFRDWNVPGAVEARLEAQGRDDSFSFGNTWTKMVGSCAKNMTFSAFGRSCVMLRDWKDDGNDVELVLHYQPVNYKYPMMLLVGLLILQVGPFLSEKIAFYYACGVSLGVVLSVFLLSYFVLKRLSPSKNNSVWVALALQSVFGAFAYLNKVVLDTMEKHQNMIVGYVLFSVMISFFVTHWYLRGGGGPGAGLRDIIRWSLKLLGYSLIFNATGSLQLGICFVVIMISYFMVFPACSRGIERILFWIDPDRDVPKPKHKYLATPYLTKEEFRLEGEIATEIAKKQLFASPMFQRWAVKNSDRIHVRPRSRSQDEKNDALLSDSDME